MIQHFTQHLPNIDVGLNVGSSEHYVGSPNIDISDVWVKFASGQKCWVTAANNSIAYSNHYLHRNVG